MEIRKAERKAKKLKMAIQGVSGAGKTWTALELATGLKGDGRILLIDTERSSSELYADNFDFDVINLEETEVEKYLQALKLAVKNGYSVVVIDSLSHAWESLLEEHDAVTNKGKYNSYTAWGVVTPIYKQLVQGIVSTPLHVIVTMRSKSEYILEEYSDGNGKTKTKPKKVGLAPVFRQGGEYEFDVVAIMDLEHNFMVEKSRIDFIADKVIKKPKADLGEKLAKWLDSGKKEPVVNYAFSYDFSTMTEDTKKEVLKELKAIKWIKSEEGLVKTESKLSEKWDGYNTDFPIPETTFNDDDLPDSYHQAKINNETINLKTGEVVE